MFYLIEISDTASGVAKAITEKTSLDSAYMTLHQTLASAMANEQVHSCMCMVIDAVGAVQRYEYWERASA